MKRDDQFDQLRELVAQASDQLILKSREQAKELTTIAASAVLAKQDANVRQMMQRLVETATARIRDIEDSLVEVTGATRRDAQNAAMETPLGRSLMRIVDTANAMLRVANDTQELITAADLGELRKRLDWLQPTDDVIDAIVKLDAIADKLRSGGEVRDDFVEAARTEALTILEGKENGMQKSLNGGPTAESVLDGAERDQFGNVKDPGATLAAMRKAASAGAPIRKSGEANERLETLAKSRAEKDGIDFYDAYHRVGAENPELLAEAVTE
ncbi:MAG: hypothetical protein ACE37M_07930 [Henriciella sp.]